MTGERPDPDRLLSSVENESSRKGKLRIYFGYAAGVGKSYAMLKGAHELKTQGVDIVVGYLEPHGRIETEELLQGLEQIAPKEISQTSFRELDIDVVLKRNPSVVLVDEMAHTNADGSRHAKRWQDIDELLNAGINVHTTVNVQHLGSLNDIVAQITGIAVRETIPDSLFDKADEVTLVDITPDELLKRLKAGKVYRTAQAELALGNYFKKSNLVALREIALRRTAERVHADVDQARLTANIQTVFPTQERLACLIDSDSASASALRATARLSSIMQCPWRALAVDSARQITRLPGVEKKYQMNLQLAKELGGKIVNLAGVFRVSEVIRWARAENITKLIIARPKGFQLGKWFERFVLFFLAHDLDILWIHPSALSPEEKFQRPETNVKKFSLRPYIETTGIVFFAFCVAAILGSLKAPEADLAVVYILGVIFAAVLHGEGASAWAAILSAFILSFGLTNFTWRVSWGNTQYLVDFGLSLAIGLLASQMTSRLKNQATSARRDREQTEALYNFTTVLAGSTGFHQIVATARAYLQKLFGRQVVIFLPDAQNNFHVLIKGSSFLEQDPAAVGVVSWVAQNNQPAGPGTQTLPQAHALYLPLRGSEQVIGVLAIARAKDSAAPPPDRAYYERFTLPLAAKIENARIAENAEQIYLQAERERVRGDLLSSVSQGLKTPLDVLSVTSASLLNDAMNDAEGRLSPMEKREMLSLIRDESQRLKRLVDNLTHLNRFESGRLPISLQKIELNEFVASEISKLQRAKSSHKILLRPHPSSIPALLDPLLFAQVIFNIVDNAVEYTPRGSSITIITTLVNNAPRLIIEDEGEGIPPEHLEKIFEKYYRLSSRSRGAGLGLTVCRAIVEAHGARLWAENKSPKGLRLVVELKK